MTKFKPASIFRNHKTKVAKHLAILGGRPLFDEPLAVGKPYIPDRRAFLKRVEDILDRAVLSNDGPLVRLFEERVAELLHVEHVVAVCSGTVALELAVRALELSGNVIVPSFTYVATPHALAWHGITPRFCDIDPETHNLDPGMVEELVDDETSAILGVHVWGRPCAVDELSSIAHKRHLNLIFDAAHAFGCSYKEKMLGGFGDVEALSFHATKFVSTFEGGALATDDRLIADQARRMRDFGHDEHRSVVQVGTNAKMPEISAALGLTGLENFAKLVDANRRVYQAYTEALQDIPGIRLVEYDSVESHNYQYIVVEIDEAEFGLSRDQLNVVLRAENIFTRRYFSPPCHQLEPYQEHARPLPKTESLSGRVLSLPGGAALTSDMAGTIGQFIGIVSQAGRAIQADWPQEAVPVDSLVMDGISLNGK